MPELNQDAIQSLLDAGAKPSLGLVDINQLKTQQIPVLYTPKGFEAKLMPELEKHLPQPLRKKAVVSLDDADSFIWYVKEHGSLASCRIYLTADYPAGRVDFLALINDHTAEEAHWRDHKAKFSPAKSVEWLRWTKQNKQAMGQLEFASWIEDNMADIAAIEGMPNASQMLEMALTFEAVADKKFKSATRLQSGGIQMEYVDTEDSATRARMQMFERFSLGLPVMQGGDAYRLDARLKYRIRDGVLVLWFELVRPDKVLEAAARDLTQKIRDEAGFPLLMGTPFND